MLVLQVEIFGKCSIYKADFAEFSAEVKLEINCILNGMANRSFVPGTHQVSDIHKVRLEFQSGLWVGLCHLMCYCYITKERNKFLFHHSAWLAIMLVKYAMALGF